MARIGIAPWNRERALREEERVALDLRHEAAAATRRAQRVAQGREIAAEERGDAAQVRLDRLRLVARVGLLEELQRELLDGRRRLAGEEPLDPLEQSGVESPERREPCAATSRDAREPRARLRVSDALEQGEERIEGVPRAPARAEARRASAGRAPARRPAPW